MREPTRRWPAIAFAAIVASALTACNGSAGSGGGAVAPNLMPQSATSEGISPDAGGKLGPVNIAPGEVIGLDNRFTPPDGDTSTGGQGQKVGTITCDAVEHVNNYHVHYYLGLVVAKKQIAIPDTIGLMHPGPEQNGYTSTASCWYWIHTHDATGMMHIEDPRDLPPSSTVFKLGAALSVWGITASSTNFGKFKGPVHVFVGNVPLKTTTVSKYTAWTKPLAQIPLHSHTAIWVEVGSSYFGAKALPPVTFYTEY